MIKLKLVLVILLLATQTMIVGKISYDERMTLIQLYEYTNGDSWKNTIDNNKKWKDGDGNFLAHGSEKDWYGIIVDNNNEEVIGIDLHDNDLTGSLPTIELGLLKNLEKLDLSNNNLIGEINDSIIKTAIPSRGSGERNLNLDGNKLFAKGAAVVPWLQSRDPGWERKQFGPSHDALFTLPNLGLWLKNTQKNELIHIEKDSPLFLTNGDIDGNGVDDILGLWTTYQENGGPDRKGLWIKFTGGTWFVTDRLKSPLIALTCGDLNGDGRDDIIGSWDAGIHWRDSKKYEWHEIENLPVSITTPPKLIAAGDFHGTGQDDLVCAWDNHGVWIYYVEDNRWSQIYTNHITALTTGFINSDHYCDVVISEPGRVFYIRPNSSIIQHTLANSEAAHIAAGDINGQGQDDLLYVGNSQNGVFVRYSETGNWSQLSEKAGNHLVSGKFGSIRLDGWHQTYGYEPSDEDFGDYSNFFNACKTHDQDPEQGFIFTGITYINGPRFFNVKINSHGVWQWNMPYDLDNDLAYDEGYSISPFTFGDDDKGYIIGDITEKECKDGCILLKIDMDGKLIWKKCITNEFNVPFAVTSVFQSHDGGFIAAGWSSGGAVISKTSKEGDIVHGWGGVFDESEFSGIREMKPILNSSNAIVGYILVGFNGDDNNGPCDICVCKVDLNGDVDWFRRYDDGDIDGPDAVEYISEAYSVEQTSYGFIVAGYKELPSNTGVHRDLWILKINNDGTIQDDYLLGVPELNEENPIIEKKSSNEYVLSGSSTKVIQSDSRLTQNLFVYKIDDNVTVLAYDIYNGGNCDGPCVT